MAATSSSVRVVEGTPMYGWANVYVPRVSHNHPQPLQEILQDQQVGLAQAPIKLPFLSWVLEHVRFCVYSLSVKSLFPSVLWGS